MTCLITFASVSSLRQVTLFAQAPQPVINATPTSLTNAPLTQLGILVPDIHKAARGYADLSGIAVPEVKKTSLERPNGKKDDVLIAYVPCRIYLEILQPVTKEGTIHAHLQKFGIGIHHVGVGIDSDLDTVRTERVEGRQMDGRREERYLGAR